MHLSCGCIKMVCRGCIYGEILTKSIVFEFWGCICTLYEQRSSASSISLVARGKLFNNSLLYALRKKLLLVLSIPYLRFPNPPHIHLVYGPISFYASPPNLLLVWGSSSAISSPFFLPHHHTGTELAVGGHVSSPHSPYGRRTHRVIL